MHQTSLADAERRCCVINWRQSRIFAVVAVLAALMLAVACAPDDNDDDNDVNDADPDPIVDVFEHEEYGTILVDGEGFALYVFDNDVWGEEPVSNCDENCRENWPVLDSDTEEPLVGEGVPDGIPFGTIAHPTDEERFHVTVDGMPLYNWRADLDADPGATGGQGVGEVWWLVAVDLDEGTVAPLVEEDNGEEDNGDE